MLDYAFDANILKKRLIIDKSLAECDETLKLIQPQ